MQGADGKFIIEGEAHHVSIVSSVSHRDIVVLTKRAFTYILYHRKLSLYEDKVLLIFFLRLKLKQGKTCNTFWQSLNIKIALYDNLGAFFSINNNLVSH